MDGQELLQPTVLAEDNDYARIMTLEYRRMRKTTGVRFKKKCTACGGFFPVLHLLAKRRSNCSKGQQISLISS